MTTADERSSPVTYGSPGIGRHTAPTVPMPHAGAPEDAVLFLLSPRHLMF